MSFDFFLANLLFGMTLLTASMAAAHFIGDFLVARMQVGPRARVVIRTMSLLCCSLLSLLLFLVKLSGPELNKAFAPGAGAFEPRLSKKIKVTQKATPNENSVEKEGPSWTFVETLSNETTSELKMQAEILKKSGRWLALADSQHADECRDWLNKAKQLGLAVAETSMVPSASDAKIFVCASNKHSSQVWQNLRDLVSRGGSVFLTGRFSEPDTNVLSQLLQVKSWRKPSADVANNFIFGGPLFSYGGFAPGLKISLSPAWSQGGLQALVMADGQNQLVDDKVNPENAYTSFIAKSFSNGRVVWTSLPASLSEKNKFLYGRYWDLAIARTLSYLAKLPSVGVSGYPGGKKPVVVPVIHAEYDFKNARDLNDQLAKLKIPSSYYLVMSEALNDRGTVKRISKEELGASSFDHSSLDKVDFFERVMQWQKWKDGFKSLDLYSDKNQGALVIGGQGQPADTLAAAMANRFSYAVGDPFNDNFSVRAYALKETDSIKRALADKSFQQTKGSGDEIFVLPIATGDDFEFYQDGSLASANDMERALNAKSKLSEWSGGPFVLTMHTQVLGTSQGRDVLKNLLDSLIAKEWQFLSAKDYIRWWQSKASIDFKLESSSDREMIVTITNAGTEKASQLAVVYSESDLWSLTGDSRSNQNNKSIKDLEPGESTTLVFKKHSL